MNLDELTAGVRRHYENGYSNIGEFIEAHDDRLPPELIEEARAAAHNTWCFYKEQTCACVLAYAVELTEMCIRDSRKGLSRRIKGRYRLGGVLENGTLLERRIFPP